MNKPASTSVARILHRPSSPLCRWLPAVTVIVGTMLTACGPSPNFLRAMHSPPPVEEVEETVPEDQENTDEEAGGVGQRHKGEEGKMGRPTSKSKSGLYAMKGPRDAVPQMARSFDPEMASRNAGILGVMQPGLVVCDGCNVAGNDRYQRPTDNPWKAVLAEPLSTFSIDVDTASYAIVRRFLGGGSLPPAGAVRIEELINYFDYDYAPPPEGSTPFAVHVEIAGCPWNAGHRLARIGLKGREVDFAQRPPGNLVFLLDVSGSMRDENKLPYVKEAMRMLVDRLGENDRVAIVVYAGKSGLVLPSMTADQRQVILSAIDHLEAGGSTNGGEGIRLAYDTATQYLVAGGTNRVILCTDGDFNVGTTSESELVDLIEAKAKGGVFLSVAGFGRGNYNDSTMEKLADKGNGNYAYIDTLAEARKVFVEQLAGTLLTIAKDVKIQVDFNPAKVAGYRLIGYENRTLRAEDFKDDAKDAGEIGAGHEVTALYELVPAGQAVPADDVEPSRYQTPGDLTEAAGGSDSITVRLRYKEPDGDVSRPLAGAATDAGGTFDGASADFRWAAAVAQFGLLLRNSKHAGEANWASTREIAQGGVGEDRNGYRAEFLRLVEAAARLRGANLASAR